MAGEILQPRDLVLPDMKNANQTSNAPTGEIGISGAKLIFFDGSAWKIVTTN